MEPYEYAQLEYTTYKGAFLKGTMVMAYLLVTESSENLLLSLLLMQALNELGREGWMVYRVDYTDPTAAGL